MKSCQPVTSFALDVKRYNPSDVDDILNSVKKCSKRTNRQSRVEYYNIPIAFDTEASSWYNEAGDKRACMYAWTVGINGKVIFGRTHDELMYVFNRISQVLHLYSKLRVICYAHNLAYDFQWIAKRMKFDKIFALDKREVVYAISDLGIEFRCSFILSNFSLAKVGENLLTYKVEKKVGDLEYNLVRHTETPLTSQEIGYCLNDSLVVMAYIQESIERNDNDITKIPLTNTGYVRSYFRNACLHGDDEKESKKYKNLIRKLTLEVDEYDLLKRLFAGGFTHANYLYVGQVLENITSYDLTSAYPSMMVAQRYPMSKGVKITEPMSIEQFHKYLDTYCCAFTIKFKKLEAVVNGYDTMISISKCLNEDAIRNDDYTLINNGRIYRCNECITSMTEVDYEYISWLYDFDENDIEIYEMWIYQRGYLPTPFIKALLELYKKKTIYKGDKEHEAEYQHTKGEFNASYGMTVMDVCRDVIEFIPENMKDSWTKTKCNREEVITKYNKNRDRFTHYAWGCWVTSYTRQVIATAIIRCGADYVYSDTDSIKIANADDHKDYFDEYNAYITRALRLAMDYHKMDYSWIEPETLKGDKKPLGVWDFDGFYTRFKTLGAKRYLVEYYDDVEERLKLKLTVSGLNGRPCFTRKIVKNGKEVTVEFTDDELRAIPMEKITDALTYMRKVCDFDNTRVFEFFTAGTTDETSMLIPAGKTGNSIHTYIDYETSGEVTDYLGNTAPYHEYSSIHMEGSTYKSSLAGKFADFLKGKAQERRSVNYV